MENADTLDSKIKKVRIELPHYSFSHSSSGESSHFVGRKQIQKKLAKLIEATTDKTGVYLVTGNRGVGKTSLVNKVINRTSLSPNSGFLKNLKYWLILLFSVAVTQFCLQGFEINLSIMFGVIFILSFILQCRFNSYRYKIPKQNTILKKIRNFFIFGIKDFLISGIKELFTLINPYNPYKSTQYILKIVLVVSFMQILSITPSITPIIAFIGYSVIVLGYMLFKFGINKWEEYRHKYEKEGLSKCDIIYQYFIQVIIDRMLLIPIWNYIKNHRRLYLRINFGHKLKDEKDILRLITRTLSTEYHKYLRSFKRMLPWRAMALGSLLFLAYLFSTIVEKQKFYKPIKESDLYQASSQVHLNDSIYSKDSTYLKIGNVIYIKKDSIYLQDSEDLEIEIFPWIQKNKSIYYSIHVKEYSRYLKVEDFFGIKKDKERLEYAFANDNRPFNKAETLLLMLDQLVFEISKRVKKIPQFFLCKDEKIDFDKEFIPPINYLFWLSFFSMYLFCILIFRCNWITHFFVTNRIIKKQLRRLNSDITYSTERESSVKSEKFGAKIGIKAKKSRGVADAREIEKELQDILENVQRIPIFMCRPNIVIVFDELDKVEPGESNLENENQKTKALLFSINNTREKQTEILKILSNMKYFLSTVKAKFIFIAGREMYDIYLADVSDRNNYIGSIFNAVIYVPSFLTDHSVGIHADMTSLTEEFICRRLIPHDHLVESYNLKIYRDYLKEKIYNEDNTNKEVQQKIQKIIAVLQQFIIYLAHVSKGAPKEMMQLFDSFIEICKIDKKEEDEFLVVQHYHSSKFFLTFNYHKQYMLGIIAYIITPIINRLSGGNINKEHSDKLLVSSLRFIDFLFKFHKHPFSWKHLDISPEMLEVNRSPELKSVAVNLLNYLAQIHINKPNFSFSDYKFDNLIASEISAVTKTDEVFSALFSFSLDETLSLKKHYQDLLEMTQKEYQNDKNSPRFIDAISSLQVVLGDLHYYDDELEEAGVYYKNAVQELHDLKLKKDEKKEKDEKNEKDGEVMTLEQHYLYVRNMLRLGMIYEKRKQYDFAYLTYGEICKRIIRVRDITIKELDAGIALRECGNEIVFVKTSTARNLDKEKRKYYDNIEIPIKPRCITAVGASIASPQPLNFKNISPNTNDMLFKKMTYEGLRMLYLPFIAKLQILEKSHIGGITPNHLEQLEKEIKFLTYIIDHEEAKFLEAEFFSRLADILYYKNSDLKCKKKKNRKEDDDKDNDDDKNKSSDDFKDIKNNSCTACYYYHKALSILLGLDDSDKIENKDKNTVTKLLYTSVERVNDNYNMKYCTVLARILSDWGNVFFSCDDKHTKFEKNGNECYICDAKDCNTRRTCYRCACYICDVNDCKIRYTNSLGTTLEKYINYVNSESEEKNRNALLNEFNSKCNFSKMEIAFAMYAISLKAYAKSNLYKRSAYQIFKMLRLFKYYKIYNNGYIEKLSRKAIRSLWQANEDLNMFEVSKRKKDFDMHTTREDIPLQNILVDSKINRIRILVKELKLKSNKTTEKLKEYYDLYMTSPYGIIYSIPTRIYQLRLKATVNYEAYKILIYNKDKDKDYEKELEAKIKFILDGNDCNEDIETIFKEYLNNDKNYLENGKVSIQMKIDILEKFIAETIFCLKEIIRLSKTIGETYLFNHILMGSTHKKLTFWIRLYEIWKELYEKEYKEKKDDEGNKLISQIGKYLKKYLGEEWEEQLSGYYESQQALSHYYKCLETHNEGRAYHNMIDDMCYIKDDYNDRSEHFSIAEERHNILNEKIKEKINELKELYQDSELYNVDNYYENG